MNRLNPITIKAADLSATGEFAGYASTWQRDLHGDRIARGAWSESIASNERVAMLWHHVPVEPIGAWLRFVEDDVGLQAYGKLTLDIQRAREALALMKDGAVGLSVGYTFDNADTSWDAATQSTVIHKAMLIETSIVAVPANRGARVTSVKQALRGRPELESYFKQEGFSNRMAKRLAAVASGEISQPAIHTEPDVDWDAIALQIAVNPLF